MAQPNAQTAENLVALDAWVRRGGRVLLLADPLLEWPNQRALGDPLRPPVMFADTGLLGHWGLRLDTPDRRGPQHENLGGSDVLTISPGRLPSTLPPASTARSTITEPGFIEATWAALTSFGAGRPGIRAVVITMSCLAIWLETSSACLAWYSALISLA